MDGNQIKTTGLSLLGHHREQGEVDERGKAVSAAAHHEFPACRFGFHLAHCIRVVQTLGHPAVQKPSQCVHSRTAGLTTTHAARVLWSASVNAVELLCALATVMKEDVWTTRLRVQQHAHARRHNTRSSHIAARQVTQAWTGAPHGGALQTRPQNVQAPADSRLDQLVSCARDEREGRRRVKDHIASWKPRQC